MHRDGHRVAGLPPHSGTTIAPSIGVMANPVTAIANTARSLRTVLLDLISPAIAGPPIPCPTARSDTLLLTRECLSVSRSPISVHITRLNVRPTGSRAQHARSVRIVGLRQEPCDGSWKLSSSFPTSRRWVRPRARRPASGCHHRLDQALEAKRDLDLDDEALGELVPPGSSRTPTATRSQRLIPAQRIDPDIRLTMALRQPRSPTIAGWLNRGHAPGRRL